MERIVYEARRERRREQRYAADVESILVWEGIHEPVIIQNISTYGALLAGRNFPEINTRVTLIGDGFEVCATVIWLGADRCGLLLSGSVQPLEIIRGRPVRTIDRAPSSAITLDRIRPGFYA